MMRIASVLGALTVLMSAAPAVAQQRSVFAVLPFENSGSYGQDKEVFEALELGVPAMLSRALSRHPAAAVAEPSRVARAMAGLALGPGQRVDAASAAQVAQGSGARYTVTGSFSDFYGKFRVTARVVDGQTGEILKVVGNDDPKLQDRGQLWALLQHVADRIAGATGLPDRGESAASPLPPDAITEFSRGLLHEQRGDRARALEAYQRALRAAPGFEEAEAGARRVRAG